MHDTDIRLMLEVQSGNIRSFEELLAKHQKGVLNVIYRYVNNEHLAEDLAQEAFLRIYKARSSYQPQAKFTTWLYKIVTNLCLNELKRHKKTYSLDQAPDQADIKPSQPAEKTETINKVKEVIADLPPNQRMAVVLNKYQGLPYEAIAQSLGISAKAVKSLLARARANIKERLAGYVNKNK